MPESESIHKLTPSKCKELHPRPSFPFSAILPASINFAMIAFQAAHFQYLWHRRPPIRSPLIFIDERVSKISSVSPCQLPACVRHPGRLLRPGTGRAFHANSPRITQKRRSFVLHLWHLAKTGTHSSGVWPWTVWRKLDTSRAASV